MTLDLYKDGIGYVTSDVSTVCVSEANLNEENRMKFVTDLAAVSRGKEEAKNPEKRYLKLLNEAAPVGSIEELLELDDVIGSPSRPLEFLPVVVEVMYGTTNLLKICGKEFDIGTFTNHFGGTFGYIENDKLYTNMRALLNAGISYNAIPYNSKSAVKDFKAIKAKIPMFVWAQVPNTHTAISKEAQSDRMVTINEYWLPGDFIKRCRREATLGDNTVIESKMLIRMIGLFSNVNIVEALQRDYTQREVLNLFKKLHYKKEVYSRSLYYFKYKEVVMTGWKNNPIVWDHLFIERSTVKKIWSNWTQEETRVFVNAIKDLITLEGKENG